MERPVKSWLGITGFCGILSPVIAFSGIYLSIANSPWFCWNIHALSDLGVSPVATIFNTSLIVSGLLSVVFAFGLRTTVRNILGEAGVVLFVMGGTSLLGIGVFPTSAGRLHAYFSGVFFVLEPVSLLLIGASLTREPHKHEQAVGSITIALAVIVCLVWVYWFQGRRPLIGIAVPEIQSAFALSSGSIIFGVRLLVTQRNQRAR